MRCLGDGRLHRIAVLVLICVHMAACGSSKVVEPSSNPVPGNYVVIWTRTLVSCAPQPLPLPLSSDTTQYAAIPVGPASYKVTVQVHLTGAAISVIPQSATGGSIAALSLNGLLAPVDSAYLSRSSNQTEGARAGGHSFSVIETAADSAEFTPLVETPPGNRLEVWLSGRGTNTFVFHDGGLTGPVFTTCTVVESIEGSKSPTS
jgi:hypothetical protein